MRTVMILFLLSEFMQLGCTRMSNKMDALKLDCGEIGLLSENQTIVSVRRSNGIGFTQSELESLQGRVIAPSRTITPLKFTERGCLVVSESEGLVQVISRSGSETLQLSNVESSWFDNSKSRSISLQDHDKTTIVMNCPAGGIFANKEIDFPLIFGGNQNLKSLEIDILARDSKTQITTSIFKKAYGQEGIANSTELSVESLASGELGSLSKDLTNL